VLCQLSYSHRIPSIIATGGQAGGGWEKPPDQMPFFQLCKDKKIQL
jgi:hypothetical protein